MSAGANGPGLREAVPSRSPLQTLALRAGVQPRWRDAWNRPRDVSDDALRHMLGGLGLPCANDRQCEASRVWLDADDAAQPLPPLLSADQGAPVSVPWTGGPDSRPYELELEDGSHVAGTAVRRDNGTLELPPPGSCGYHRLHIAEAASTLAVAPKRCYGVADALRDSGTQAAAAWGLAVQLYGLRRGASTGMGDLSALALCSEAAAREHADAIAINPLHAGFAALPERYSPYAPSSRLFLNPLYADPAAVFGQAAVDSAVSALGIGAALARHELQDDIDWPALSLLRYAVLRWLWEHRERLLAPDMLRSCDAYRARGGNTLHAHACYEAIQAHLLSGVADRANASAADWHTWPQALQSPAGAGVAAFATAHAAEIAWHAFLQWLADDGLARAQQAAREAGMAIGVIGDLAVGTDPGGSHAWSRQQEILAGFHAGAPPDLYNPFGQDWGVAIFSPRGLRQHGYAAFIEMLRANLAHAGGLRIDHALGLARMWLVPSGAPAAEGAYLSFPQQDLLRLLALESWRHRAIIIGENLGTVPADFNAAMSARGVLGIGVLWFERATPKTDTQPDETVPAFLPPSQWPAQAVATTTTHDLPTVAGWWLGRDLEWRARLGLLPASDSLHAAHSARARERTALWQALGRAGLARGAEPPANHAPLEAVLAWLARTPAPLRLMPVEDLLGLVEQPNLPGTTAGHPNWRRRLEPDVRHLFDVPAIRARATALRSGHLPGGALRQRPR